jgi:hypothetical protein
MSKFHRLLMVSPALVLVLAGCLGASAASTPAGTVTPPAPSGITQTPAAPSAVVPTPTVVYYPRIEKPWNRIPTVVISAAPGDPRIPLVTKAVDYWNAQFKGVGSPFHLGTIVMASTQVPDADLMAIGNANSPGTLSAATVSLIGQMPGDLVIALSNASFVSVTHPVGAKKLIAIQGHPGGTNSALVIQNVIAHELGHAIGLGHNSDPALLMCGRPAACRPGLDQFLPQDLGPDGFALITDQEKALLLQLYPSNWQPTP